MAIRLLKQSTAKHRLDAGLICAAEIEQGKQSQYGASDEADHTVRLDSARPNA
jgi:hypothetical protein